MTRTAPPVQYPINRSEPDFAAFAAGLLERYVSHIAAMNPSDTITTNIKEKLPNISQVCELLKQAIHDYLRGLPHKAFARLEEAIDTVSSDFHECIVTDVDHPFLRELYRIRLRELGVHRMSKRDLFHVPFELRHKVQRQRFSIPGLPCLYLGGSLYVCWEEMNRPSFHEIFAARYSVATGQKLHFLSLLERPEYIASRIKSNPAIANSMPRTYTAFAVCWPLRVMSSIQRKHSDAPFIAEYIVPQLLLQWITDKPIAGGVELDGIAYASVRLDSRVEYPATICNLVLPARILSSSGCCSHLQRKFTMTDPVNLPLLEHVVKASRRPQCAEVEVELIPGYTTRYVDTGFGQFESQLLELNCSEIV